MLVLRPRYVHAGGLCVCVCVCVCACVRTHWYVCCVSMNKPHPCHGQQRVGWQWTMAQSNLQWTMAHPTWPNGLA